MRKDIIKMRDSGYDLVHDNLPKEQEKSRVFQAARYSTVTAMRLARQL